MSRRHSIQFDIDYHLALSSLDHTSKIATMGDSAEKLLADLEQSKTLPLWAQMSRLNPPEPNPQAVPFVWEYEKIRPNLLRAGNLITEKQAERRVLMLVNPARGMDTV
jgi:gentisate 1,2-dioxygenase